MGMGSCDKCWDNPCMCGEGYSHMKYKDLQELSDLLIHLCFEKEKEIQASCKHEDLHPMREDFPCPEIVSYKCQTCLKTVSLEEAEKCQNSNNTLKNED